jgi:GDP-mannose 6-dehydrogenase
MKICVVGLGYVGTVTAACLAERGHTVTGVDVSPVKVKQITAGEPPVAERLLDELVERHVGSGALSATETLDEAWPGSEIVIVCVGTPSAFSGDVDLTAITAVTQNIGELLARRDGVAKTIVITSTIPPGTLSTRIRPTLEAVSGLTSGRDFGLCFVPEFLREGTAVTDFLSPVNVVIGADHAPSIERLTELLAVSGPPVVTSPEVAEMVKFASNSWHALKVAYANEIGRMAQTVGVSSHEVMDIFTRDDRLNISARYLSPGFAFGGSCLPKDLRTLTYRARAAGVRIPVIEATMTSNDEHLAFALRRIDGYDPERILVLGLAFKAGTDDLRESPSVPLVESLLGRGHQVRIYDECVQMHRLVGANRDYVQRRLPHLIDLLENQLSDNLAGWPDLVVICQSSPTFLPFLHQLGPDVQVLDLTGVADRSRLAAGYAGLTW